MDRQDERDRRIADLEKRLSRLGQASLRISESLDVDTVLQEVVDSARALTGSRYGAITVRREAGRISDLIVSGVSSEERLGLMQMPEAPAFFEYLSGLTEPLRISDIDGHMTDAGMPSFRPPLPATALLVAPIRHQGVGVGTVYLAHDQEEREYTREDQETLVMFASQAAMVITNARRHRAEQQARADLETLMYTSPVGVILFDAQSGTPISFNREARRIVDRLREPNQTPEELLHLISYRRGDGRQLSVAEFPLTRSLTTGETVRGEEIVLQAPDGRQVSTIINATPIHSDDGDVQSVVVTMQDLSSLEQFEQMRADFLAMVSHELRAPLSSIKGSAATLLQSGVALDPAAVSQFHRIIEQQADHMQDLITDLLDIARIEAGTLAVSPQPVGVEELVEDARSTFLTSRAGRDLQVELPPNLPPVMADRRRIVQVLLNLLSNAARHSPDDSTVRISAAPSGVEVDISVTDLGEGIEASRLPQRFSKFSHSSGEPGREAAASGLGLAICKGIVEAHGGRIQAESDGPGRGARFSFSLPATETAAVPQPNAVSESPAVREQGHSGRTRILAVDDDPQTLLHVRDSLTRAGYEPIMTGDPDAVGQLVAEHRPHLVLLDLMLPEVDGIELMELVPELRDVPVIFISAYGGDRRVARALENGADDYIVKPFSPTEVGARIRTVLRRWTMSVSSEPARPFTLAGLTVNYTQRRASVDGQEMKLTELEFRMLVELSMHAGRARSHAELLRSVWGPGHSGRAGAVRTVVKQLRRKLGDNADNPTYIVNEPRYGYRMPNPEQTDVAT
ncbi:MAG: response regulator [Acidobacteria bacterium]|nr:response regulator [Acidobacteriota bacterium]